MDIVTGLCDFKRRASCVQMDHPAALVRGCVGSMMYPILDSRLVQAMSQLMLYLLVLACAQADDVEYESETRGKENSTERLKQAMEDANVTRVEMEILLEVMESHKVTLMDAAKMVLAGPMGGKGDRLSHDELERLSRG